MNIQKEYFELTEEETIKLTIKFGESGSEFNTAAWKERGCLKPDNTFKAFIEKLNRYFEEVTIKGNGKKRRYTLLGLLEKPLPKITKYKGRQMKEKDILMPYVLHELKGISNEEKVKGTIKFITQRIFPVIEYRNKKKCFINECYSRMKNTNIPVEKIKEIAFHLWDSFELTLEDTFNTLIDNLEKEGYILVKEVYLARYKIDGKIDYDLCSLTPKEVEELKALEKRIIHHYGMSTQAYYRYFKLQNNVPNKVLSIREKIKNALQEELQIEKYFKSLDIQIDSSKIQASTICKDDIYEVLLERFANLTLSKVGKKKYINGLSYRDKFHKLALLVFMCFMSNSDKYELLLLEELIWTNIYLEEFKEYYRKLYFKDSYINFFDEIQQNEPTEYDLLMSDYYAELSDEEIDKILSNDINEKPKGFVA